jgi:UV DNA damage repair endonuclease
MEGRAVQLMRLHMLSAFCTALCFVTAAQAETCNLVVTLSDDGVATMNGVHYVVAADGDMHRLSAALVPFVKRACNIHITAGARPRFQTVGRVVLAVQQAGALKIGVLTEPRNP